MAFSKKTFQIGQRRLGPLETAKSSHLAEFQVRNQERFAPYAPARSDAFYTRGYWARARRASRYERVQEEALRWVLMDASGVYAQINMDQIVRGAFQSAVLGYSLDKLLEGQGIMNACLRAIIDYAFSDLKLHRLMANHVPENERSAAVLARLGFEKEGVARDYLKLNGVWRDHVLNSLVNDAYE